MEDVRVIKIDEDLNLVFGYAYVAITKSGEQVLDHSGEFIEGADLEEAAYAFTLEFRDSGVMHEGEAVGKLVESFFVSPEKLQKMGIESNSQMVGWWVGFFIEDDGIFAKVKDGTYSMFSIQGSATRESVPV